MKQWLNAAFYPWHADAFEPAVFARAIAGPIAAMKLSREHWKTLQDRWVFLWGQRETRQIGGPIPILSTQMGAQMVSGRKSP